MLDTRLRSSYQTLRWTLGLVPLLAGLDKFLNLLADWPGYLSPAVAGMLPVSAATLMHLIGLVEVAVGLLILSRWTVLGAYIAAGWLTAIAINLALAGAFDIAVRDLTMAVAACVLARLAQVDSAATTGEMGRARVAARTAGALRARS